MSVLDKARKTDVIQEPYPHLVVREALDSQLCDALIDEFPATEVVTGGQPPGSNVRFSYAAADALADPRISQTWKRVVQEHVEAQFMQRLAELFAGSVYHHYPDFESQFGRLDQLRVGIRGRDEFPDVDVLLDAQICVNTPVVGRSTSVRGPHLDSEDKLFAGLLYLRDEQDDSTGGDLLVYKIKDHRDVKMWGPHTADQFVQPVSTVDYRRNTLVLFLNTPDSFHGVTPRCVTPHTRKFLNLIAVVDKPLFSMTSRRPSALRRASNKLGRLLRGRAA